MSGYWMNPPLIGCSNCGASIDPHIPWKHRCDPKRKLDHEMLQLHDEIDRFEIERWRVRSLLRRSSTPARGLNDPADSAGFGRTNFVEV